MGKLAFLDLETTGLDPNWHDIWEIGLILRGHGPDVEYHWQLRPPNLNLANPEALEIGRYHERFMVPKGANVASFHDDDGVLLWTTGSTYEVFRKLRDLLNGAHLVGAVPSFDDAFLKTAFHLHSLDVTWHYHLIDVEALAVGYLEGLAEAGRNEVDESVTSGVTLPWDSEKLSRAVGVDPDQFDRHTALGDARWARALYDTVTVRPS